MELTAIVLEQRERTHECSFALVIREIPSDEEA